MKLQKKQNDFTKIMSEEFFKTLKLVTNDNIRDLYNNPSSHFFVINLERKKVIVIRDLYIESLRVKGIINYKFYYDNKIMNCSVKITENQSLEDYKAESEMIKNIIKNEIKNKRLYVKEA